MSKPVKFGPLVRCEQCGEPYYSYDGHNCEDEDISKENEKEDEDDN